LWRLSRVS